MRWYLGGEHPRVRFGLATRPGVIPGGATRRPGTQNQRNTKHKPLSLALTSASHSTWQGGVFHGAQKRTLESVEALSGSRLGGRDDSRGGERRISDFCGTEAWPMRWYLGDETPVGEVWPRNTPSVIPGGATRRPGTQNQRNTKHKPLGLALTSVSHPAWQGALLHDAQHRSLE
ncbi:hypothetical protein SAMN04515695_3307 [Pseudovibrio sp. Tun.PSC04-5.I4]|nr:hypothetical protein SAMN04515695_3307 [Pseudovibrio sp. Tun.PSC04-5.I4]